MLVGLRDIVAVLFITDKRKMAPDWTYAIFFKIAHHNESELMCQNLAARIHVEIASFIEISMAFFAVSKTESNIIRFY